jgi:hypothetical protein
MGRNYQTVSTPIHLENLSFAVEKTIRFQLGRGLSL